MNKPEVLSNLREAITFISQAQDNATPGSELFGELGEVYNQIDSLIDLIEEGDYN